LGLTIFLSINITRGARLFWFLFGDEYDICYNEQERSLEMEGIGSGLLIVGFFVPVFYILLILSLPALLIIFFGQAGKSLYLKLLGRLWLLFGMGLALYFVFGIIYALITGHAY